ncbi:choice-of-anchor V domain-containing protein [Nonlabens xiamenensis]|uniref:choice-of-anchor V domain-containing protein n=1 Tax=Nonlabens xiamenensis TaxID=2341043 RepID=UPI000F60D864|nr:choice-of-anchor V domain-containing protein [Nonlabens xiamenensis]
MRKNYSFYSILTVIPIALCILVAFSSGQPGSFSGSPGDGGNTCTQCHSPGANHGGTPVLSNVPTAYAANQTYTLNLAINGSSVSKFGFNITAETAGGTKVGSWTAGTGTMLRSDNAGLTHTGSGNSSNNWNLDWTAPATDEGPVTFYYATIQANNASGNGGDQMISGNSTAVLTNSDESISAYRLFPSIASSNLNFVLANAEQANLKIYNMSGQTVIQREINREDQLDISHLASGMYLSHVSVDDQVAVQKFFKQ